MDRIALLSLHSSPLAALGSLDAGGMNSYVLRLADDLSKAGKRVDVFTRRTDEDTPEIVRTAEGARIVHLRAGPARQLPKSVLPLHIPALTASLRAFSEREQMRYDVLHSHYWLSGLVALRYRDDVTVPIVHMFHTLSRVKEFYLGRPDPSDSALRPDGERSMIEDADVVVGATEGEHELMERLYCRTPVHYTVIPPGVDTSVFRHRDRDESRRKLGIGAERVVLFVGRMDGIKGLDVLLRSMAELQSHFEGRLTLVVVGGDEPETRERRGRYRQMIMRLGLQNVVEIRGVVPQTELPLYYSAADICALPSAYESFGMAAVESMACQTPVVAFRTGGHAVTIKDGETGFLARPGNPADFTRKLFAALESNMLDIMGRRACMSVQRYNWTTSAQRTMELYEQVVLCRQLSYERAL